MKVRKSLAVLAAAFLATGCMEHADGTTPGFFSDLKALASGGSDGTSPQQQALREQSEEYKDYAAARVQGAAVGAAVGALLGAAVDKDNRGRGALIGGALGGAAGYAGASYLTRDHSQFAASQEALNEDIEVAQELTASSRRNVQLAQSALDYQRSEVQRLNEAHTARQGDADEYETMLGEIAKDRQSVRSMISETETRITKMNSSISTYSRSGYDTAKLEQAAAAQKRDIANLRRIEDAMVDLISGAPAGIARPTV